MKVRLLRLRSGASRKLGTTLCFITGTAVAVTTATTATTATPLIFQLPDSNFLTYFSDSLGTGVDGLLRSSRAACTIASNVIDYKYSLHGLSADSDDYHRILPEVHLRSAKRILKLCEANKGFYVKAGQFVAALRQVPKEYSSTLSSLQDKATPCHFKAIKEVLIGNLGRDLSEMFSTLD